MLVVFAVSQVANADLPHIQNGEWRGYFGVHESQRYVYIYNHTGQMTLIPFKRSKEWVAIANRLNIEYGIEEMKPDGTTVFKKTRIGSLESDDEATKNLDRLVVRGTTTGDAVYEMIIEQSRDIMSIGGRVLDAGELTEYPIRFSVRVKLPNVYRRVGIMDKDEQREFEKLTRRDYFEAVRWDHSKVNLDHDDSEVMDYQGVTSSGLEEIEMRLSYYEGRRFFFNASRKSGIAISSRTPGPWYEGMTLHWTSDANQDPEGKARLSFWVK